VNPPAVFLFLLIVCLLLSISRTPLSAGKDVPLAGAQLEFPIPTEVISTLDSLLVANPSTQMFVLSEYTFDGSVPENIKGWCREHRRYLIAGGKDDAPNGNFYNTAFVIGPMGEIVFRQAKRVPIQFFKDGLPAPEQKLWDSPWGKIGICICYDLSYTRVTDQLIRLGAQAIIVPTMDVADWGRRQHELHARVAPVRAAEYGVPIFRLASSGFSQCVDRSGKVTAIAPFPGPGATLSGSLTLGNPGSLLADRWLAPFATGLVAAIVVWLVFRRGKGNGSNL
jgi:apolipoprotein N-acyltransferase